MQKRFLGNSDLHITPIGLGAWAMGGNWKFGWGEQADSESIATIHRALELGINWIDTAAVYGFGHSERVVAKALASWHGRKPYIFTKCGRLSDGAGGIRTSLRAASLRREVDESRERLQTDVIDLYQIHWPATALEETEEGWRTLAELQSEGKVRWIGVSNFSVAELVAAQRIAAVTSLQPPYSLARRAAEEEEIPWCEAQGIGVIVYSPMASGLLTGAMSRERVAQLPKEDWRTRNPEFQEPRLSAHLAAVERLRAVAARHGRNPGEAAIAWTLRRSEVTGAIVGARHPEQLDGIIGALDLDLSAGEIAEIDG